MKYNVDALKKMIDTYTSNIAMFSKYKDVDDRINEMVIERRMVAALVENDGVQLPGVTIDSMLYSASMPNADTSWWTRGT